MRHYLDDVTTELADSEAALLEHVVELTIERDSYRDLAHEAIHALHNLAVDRARLAASHHRLIHDYRTLREQMMRQVAA